MKGKNIRTIRLLLLVGILFCESAYSKDVETIKIRLPWLHQSQYAGVYVAKEKGFFEKRRKN